ncbi:MAG: MFS transporter [Marinilabiliaceae bacterium]|jgi:MFS family permease|nr:MFS transporter [Marinilabiliaceae bacterium]
MDTKNRQVLAILFTGVLMGALDISIVGPAIPAIESTLEVESRLLGWIFSIYVLFNLVGISLFARLSDIFGRRQIYILSLLIFGLGSVIVSFSGNFTALLTGRAIQGLGASGIFPVASAVIGDIFPPEKRGRVLGIIGAVFGIAFIIGPVIAGILLSYFKWNALFLINIPVVLILVVASRRYLPSIRVKSSGLFDWKGILTLGLMLASFTYGINNLESSQFTESLLSRNVLPFLLFTMMLLVLNFIIEKNADNPIIKLVYLRNRQFVIAGIIAMATGVLQASFVFIPSFAVGIFDIDSSAASFMLVPLVMATAIGSPVFGRLIDSYGSRLFIIIALVLSASGFYLLHSNINSRFLFYIAGILIGLGLSVLAGSSLRYIMLNETSAVDRAVTQGMLTIFISLGQLTGASLIGVLIAQASGMQGYRNVFLYQALMLGLILFVALFLKSHSREISNKQPD